MTEAMWTAVYVIGFINALWLAIALWPGNPVRALVFSNLDSAQGNHYFDPGADLDGMSPDEIAYDLTQYAATCERYQAVQLSPYVREWMQLRGLAPEGLMQ